MFVQLDEQFHSKDVHKWLLGLEGSIDQCYQGSTFVPDLLNIFIDDLDGRRERMLISSAGDTKLGRLPNILPRGQNHEIRFFLKAWAPSRP